MREVPIGPRGAAVRQQRTAEGAEEVSRALTPDTVASAFVACDPASLRLLEQIRRVAASASTVLVRGENGTGKDLVASLLHSLGPYADYPLVKIDCASLPLELLESELFGYEKGAFTGATQMKRGRLEAAGQGTLVLDEIAALSMTSQAKLLRAIDERKFDRLGGHRPITLHARIVAMTNVDLEHAVARRTFREDLFYRLNVIPLVVRPLRERPADIAPLAHHFVERLAQLHRKRKMSLTPAAVTTLEEYSYPGNVRELRNIIERAVVMCATSEIEVEDLPQYLRQRTGAATRKITLEELERAHIAEVLDYTRGRKSKAAEILGISRKTLLEKRKRYGLD